MYAAATRAVRYELPESAESGTQTLRVAKMEDGASSGGSTQKHRKQSRGEGNGETAQDTEERKQEFAMTLRAKYTRIVALSSS